MNLGTIFYTWMFGELIGSDEFGNRYYRNQKDIRRGRERRWVMYRGAHEPSKVPPEWHAWVHHTVDQPLTESAAQAPSWQKPHQPNPTGTPAAYQPHAGEGGYEAWMPGNTSASPGAPPGSPGDTGNQAK